MTSEESAAFKKLIGPMIDAAIEHNGGLAVVKRIHSMMSGMQDFLAGWVSRDLHFARNRMLTVEETRRIYDLVRLKLDTESSTS